ncbi:protein of unknown function (DUF4383) [Actinoalloteichus cyanogriseus DSM 43889]|uniref:DUF4383 domain-containing protein n=2 Tax=Pseudonocardiaceae TaxID=2070 RepID=A0ABT1JH33_ACTCY|nr:protein of unknown function (DUF4383) [Actinoalloteichus caeruleus DSM 43889]
MRMSQYLPANHPLSKVYRLGAALVGVVIIVFGVLGLVNRLPLFTTEGQDFLGLSNNGLLSLISLVVGAVLIGAAVRGGAVASTTTAVIGALFLLSGLLNLAVLNTSLNLLAFKIPNVLFSVVCGILLLSLGLYGRLSGGLPEDNPYVRARHHEPPNADHSSEIAADRHRLAQIDEIARAEAALANGHASPEQEAMVREDSRHRAEEARREAYSHYLEHERVERQRLLRYGPHRTGRHRAGLT